MTDLAKGDVLDERYEILDVLGSGGMGHVYKARQLNLDRVVAIKVPSDEVLQRQEYLARFVREGATCARISHNNVVAIYDVHSGVRPYIVMEYVNGMPLNVFLAEERTNLFVSDLLEMVDEVARGLAAAHAQGVVHRDIKPANIAVIPKQQTIKIMDFGIARVSDNTALTNTGAMMGTPYYMAPEQIQGAGVCPATDQYALACIAFQFLTGRLLFEGEIPTLIYKHVSVLPDPPVLVNPNLPVEVNDVLLRALKKNPADRYASITEFSLELRRAMRPLGQLSYSQLFETAASSAPTSLHLTTPFSTAQTLPSAVAPAMPAVTPTSVLPTPMPETLLPTPIPPESFWKRNSVLMGILIGSGLVILIVTVVTIGFWKTLLPYLPLQQTAQQTIQGQGPRPDQQQGANGMLQGPPEDAQGRPNGGMQGGPNGGPQGGGGVPQSEMERGGEVRTAPGRTMQDFLQRHLEWLEPPRKTYRVGEFATFSWGVNTAQASELPIRVVWLVKVINKATPDTAVTQKTTQPKCVLQLREAGNFTLEVTPFFEKARGISLPSLETQIIVK
ncbi:TPA: hypothetical protein DDW35_06650 [Candidatus Sumerlaeota bacterium]|jgi:serine/threonine protein kinase|nr:hypothetical protein [Candidatus Sumerlaeota bacterium]